MNQEREVTDPDQILRLKDEVLERFQQLPTAHQATFALVLLDKVMQGEYGVWMREAIALRFPPVTSTSDKLVPLVRVSQDDLQQVNLTSAEIAQLTEEDLQSIAQAIRDHFVEDVFWDELEFHARGLLNKKLQP
jgi:hypothetical protein